MSHIVVKNKGGRAVEFEMGTSRIIDVEEGHSYLMEKGDELPYDAVRTLGHGSFAQVQEVRDRRTGQYFARKVVRFNGSLAEMRRIFDNELSILKRLTQHHHVVHVFASYIGFHEVGFMLSPVVSQGSLHDVLKRARDNSLPQSALSTLYDSFGCLASGLQFMILRTSVTRTSNPITS